MQKNWDQKRFEREQLVARVCWYYHILGMTQQEIAQKLDVGRVRVNRLLAEARRNGTVKVSIDLKLVECVELEQKLIERYGLVHAEVIPFPDQDASLREVLGRCSADYVRTLLHDGVSVGVAWGKTLRAMATALRSSEVPNSSVVSLLGSMSRRSSVNTFEATTTMAQKMLAECYYLASPILADTEESAAIINSQRIVREVYEQARHVDVALLSVGGMETATLREMKIVDEDAFRDLSRHGSIGNLLGYFVGPDAEIIDHEFNRRVTCVRPYDLENVAHRVMISGGRTKGPILKALLERGYLHALITDTGAAAEILDAEK